MSEIQGRKINERMNEIKLDMVMLLADDYIDGLEGLRQYVA